METSIFNQVNKVVVNYNTVINKNVYTQEVKIFIPYGYFLELNKNIKKEQERLEKKSVKSLDDIKFLMNVKEFSGKTYTTISQFNFIKEYFNLNTYKRILKNRNTIVTFIFPE